MIAVFVLLGLGLAACGGGDGEGAAPDEGTAPADEAAEDTDGEAADEADDSGEEGTDDEAPAAGGELGTIEVAGAVRTPDERQCAVPNPDLEYSISATFLADGIVVAELLINDDPELTSQSVAVVGEDGLYAADAQEVDGTWLADDGTERGGPVVQVQDGRVVGSFTATKVAAETGEAEASVDLSMPDPASC